MQDERPVAIKYLKRSSHPHEVDISRYLSSIELVDDPRNHCCPLIDVLEDPEDANVQLLVMPLLRPYHDPRFTTVGEALEFFRQMFEVAFLASAFSDQSSHGFLGPQIHA